MIVIKTVLCFFAFKGRFFKCFICRSREKERGEVMAKNVPSKIVDAEIVEETVHKDGRGSGAHKRPCVNMRIKDDDPERVKQKADIFNRLMELKSRRGIAKFNSVEEMELIIEDYFNDCAELSLRPTIRGLADTLGVTYTTLNDWENGSRDAQLGARCSLVIKNAKAFIAEYDEVLALEGIDNPILFMFRSKNYYGMKDKTELEVAPKQQLIQELTPEEIARRIAKND